MELIPGKIYYYKTLNSSTLFKGKFFEELFLVKEKMGAVTYEVIPLASEAHIDWKQLNTSWPARRMYTRRMYKEVPITDLPLYIRMRVHSPEFTKLLKGP